MNKPELSIIFPRHNEPLRFILETITSIRETVDVEAEIIIVDDGSNVPLPDIKGVTILRHEGNFGVGQAFRTGVEVAKADNLFIMGSDIRFLPNQWASKMIEAVEQNPKSLICTVCIGLNNAKPENMNMEYRRTRAPYRRGANILFFHDHLSHPKKDKTFRNILECQWRPKDVMEGLEEIPSVLGAAYGVRKEWFEYTNMFWGHKKWGTLEPLCSLQSWLMGGNCLCHHGIETGHIFKSSGTHGTQIHHLIYNKLMLANLLLPDGLRDRLVSFIEDIPMIKEGREMFAKEESRIFAAREKYMKKISYDVETYCKKFNIDLRE